MSKTTKVIITIISGLIIIGVAINVVIYLNDQAKVNKDKQRFESALRDINKYLDSFGDNISDKQVSRYCYYGRGPWGDQGTPDCSVRVLFNAKVNNLIKNAILLGFSNSKEEVDSEKGLTYYGGNRDNLECYLTTKTMSPKIEVICYGPAKYQHYPRVERP